MVQLKTTQFKNSLISIFNPKSSLAFNILLIYFLTSLTLKTQCFTLLPAPCTYNQLALPNNTCIKCYQFGSTIQSCSSPHNYIGINTQVLNVQAGLLFRGANIVCTFTDSKQSNTLGCCDNYLGCKSNKSSTCGTSSHNASSDYSGCFYCQNSVNCNKCKYGYKIKGNSYTIPAFGNTSASTSTQYSCESCNVTNCKKCSNVTQCSQCFSGYYLDSSNILCVSCNSNCRTCTSYSCTSCLFGYNLINGLCQYNIVLCSLNSTVQNCYTCLNNLNNDIICIQCNSNYFPDNLNSTCKTCSQLHPNCSQCYLSQVFGLTFCRICQSNFYLYSDGKCHSCSQISSGCLDCSNSNVCVSCINVLYALNPSSAIITCQLCGNLMTNCKQCSSNATCTLCDSIFYFVNSSDLCQACTHPCLTCLSNDGTFCYSCIAKNVTGITYIYDNSSHLCSNCSILINNCIDCTSAFKCISCANNNVANIFDNGQTCVPCDSIHPNCILCQDNWTCLACNETFYANKVSKTCQVCLAPCKTCQNKYLCTSCLTNEIVVTNLAGSSCVPCKGLISNCQNCINNNNTIQCTLCVNNTILDSSTKTCTVCSATQYANYSANICQNCTQPCFSCASEVQCKSCIPYYKLSMVLDVNVTQQNSGHNECIQICGDQIVYEYPCDQSLGNIYDGCTDSCEIQDGFVCEIYNQSMTNYTSMFNLSTGFYNIPFNESFSICSYNDSVSMKVIRIQKNLFKNEIQVTIKLVPFLYAYNSLTAYDISKIISIAYKNNNSSAAISKIDFTFNPKAQQFSANIHYIESLTQPIQIQLDHSSLTDPRFFATSSSSIQLMLIDQNQIPATYVDQSELIFTKSLFYAMNGMSYVGILGSLASLLTGVTGGLQFAWILQTTYSSMFWYQQNLTSPLYSYLGLYPINGYNIQGQTSKNYDSLIINSTGRLLIEQQLILPTVTPQFQSNFNLMIMAFALPLFLGFLSKFILAVSKNSKYSNCILLFRKLENFFLYQMLLFSVLFQLPYLINLSVIFLSIDNLKESYLWSWILLLFCIIMIMAKIFMFAFTKQPQSSFRYGSFVNVFNDNVPLIANKFYLVYTFAIIISTLTDIFWISYPLMPFLLYIFITFLILFYSPYIRPSSNVRAALCMLTISYSYLIRIIYEYSLKFDPSSMNIVIGVWAAFSLTCMIWIFVEIFLHLKDTKSHKETKRDEFKKKLQLTLQEQDKTISKMMQKEYKSLTRQIDNNIDSLKYNYYYQPYRHINIQFKEEDNELQMQTKYQEAKSKLKPKPIQKNDISYNSFNNKKKRQSIYPQENSQRRKLINQSIKAQKKAIDILKNQKQDKVNEGLELVMKVKQMIDLQERIKNRKFKMSNQNSLKTVTNENQQKGIELQDLNINLLQQKQKQNSSNQKTEYFQNVTKKQSIFQPDRYFPKIQFFYKQQTKVDKQTHDKNMKKRKQIRSFMLANDLEKKLQQKRFLWPSQNIKKQVNEGQNQKSDNLHENREHLQVLQSDDEFEENYVQSQGNIVDKHLKNDSKIFQKQNSVQKQKQNDKSMAK